MGSWAQISLGDGRMNPLSLMHEGRRGIDKDKFKCEGKQREIEGIHV